MSDELPTPNTSSNDANTTSVGGNVTTGRDFVGRDLTVHGDQVQGDKVAGDKISAGDRGIAANQIVGSTLITGDNNTINYPRLDLKDARNQRNHATMRQWVRKFWIDGVLKSSLYNEVLIRLNLTEQPKAVDNRPWDLILKQPGQPDRTLPHGLPIIDIFDQMNGLLLILGEPGSGKTTTLLELADELLKRAESDPTYPTPVVFNLSSWAEKRQPLAEWLVEELHTKYNIPTKVAQTWVEDGELIFLLDGLDEVGQEQRNACAEAINTFHCDHLAAIVVCCRVAEYEELITLLKLQGAVLVQPLTEIQIDHYLKQMGPELSTVRTIRQADTELQELTTTPLMLSIMALAYQGVQASEIDTGGSQQNRHQHLFDAYIKRLFVHRGMVTLYSIHQHLNWLCWLADQMVHHQQTIFFIERLQPDWLASKRLFYTYRLIVVLVVGLIFGWIFGLVGVLGSVLGVVLVGGLFDGLSGDLVSVLVSVLGIVLVGVLGGALGGGLIAVLGGVLVGWLIVVLVSVLEMAIQHLVLGLLLYYDGNAPLNYARFLDYCHDRILLRKVGGGYIFIHRMLLEHFASLTDEDIKRIASDVEASR